MTNHHISASSALLNIKQTAAYLDVCTKTIRKLIKAKQLRAQRVGKQWRITPEDVRGFLFSTRT